MRRFSLVIVIGFVMGSVIGCSREKDSETRSDVYDTQRRNLVRLDLKGNGIKSKTVLDAMQAVPRHLFMSEKYRGNAYKDEDIPISQFAETPKPFVIARTLELLDLKETDNVLEVGTGRGYQSALLAELAKGVYTIEIVPTLYDTAKATLEHLNYKNVHCRLGDGYEGWPGMKPFDAIVVTAGAKEVPKPLLEQLAVGGRLVMAIGEPDNQSLVLYRKGLSGLSKEKIMSVKIDPMEGSAAGRSLKNRR